MPGALPLLPQYASYRSAQLEKERDFTLHYLTLQRKQTSRAVHSEIYIFPFCLAHFDTLQFLQRKSKRHLYGSHTRG